MAEKKVDLTQTEVEKKTGMVDPYADAVREILARRPKPTEEDDE